MFQIPQKTFRRSFANIDELNREDRHLFLFSVFLILLLSLFILSIFLPKSFGEDEVSAFKAENLVTILTLFGAIMLSCCGYLYWTSQQIGALRQNLMKERIRVEGLKQRVEELSALLDVSSTVAGKVGVRVVMDLLVQKVRECLQADQVTLMLVERSSRRLVTYAASGIHEKEVLGNEIAVGEGVEGWVVKEGEPMTFQKGQTPSLSVDRGLPDVTSLLAIPLKLDGVTIGVLTVRRLGGDKPFQEADIKLLSIFGNDAVMAIEKEIFHYNKPAFDRNDHEASLL